MYTKSLLQIDGKDIYENVVYKLDKPFYNDYLKINIYSVSFVKFHDEPIVRIHLYGNPYVENTYHPSYLKFADKIKIVGVDEKYSLILKHSMENEIEKLKKEIDDYVLIFDKATDEFNMEEK